MRRALKNNDAIFDGFAHRGFIEEIDGWINEQADAADYPAVTHARDVLSMFYEIQRLREENWRLRKERDGLVELRDRAIGVIK